MKRRKLLAGYRRGQQSRNRDINKLHGLFLARGITTMKKQDLSTGASRKEAIKALSGIELSEAEYLVTCLDLHERHIEALNRQIQEEAAGDEVIKRLQSVPGVGPMVAFAFVSHVAAERFENASQVSNYLGLVPRVYMSGDTVRYGRITKRGNGYLRALLVQGAWALTRTKNGGKLKERFEYMTVEKSISKKKAIVAIARRMAELLYTLMRDGTKYENRPFIREKKMEEIAQLAMSA
jgi:transposase